MAAKYMKKIQAISLVLGLSLFAFLIYKIGFSQILNSLRLVGSGFIVLILISGVRHLLRAAAWKKCFEADHRHHVGLFELFNVRLAGEAIRYISFTGPILGEPAKAALIKRRLPLSHGLSSVIVENLTYSLSAILIAIIGVVLLLVNVNLNSKLRWASIIISAVVLAVVAVIWRGIARRNFVLVRVMRLLERRTKRKWFAKRVESVGRMEENVFNFYNHRERTFLLVLSMQMLAHFVNIFEVYLILHYMGVNATFVAAFIIEAAMKMINAAFFFVPGQVGVFEGGNALLLRALGFTASIGVAVALVEKIRTLVWTAYGLVALTFLLRKNANKTLPKYEDANKKIQMLA
jgi:glycosyltransferase 2 family protein